MGASTCTAMTIAALRAKGLSKTQRDACMVEKYIRDEHGENPELGFAPMMGMKIINRGGED